MLILLVEFSNYWFGLQAVAEVCVHFHVLNMFVADSIMGM